MLTFNHSNTDGSDETLIIITSYGVTVNTGIKGRMLTRLLEA